MPAQQRTLNVIAVPAGERQPPGWFALHPGQFASDAERRAAYGRWHCLSSAHGQVYRALQFREDLPADGIALDWVARTLLEGQRGEVAECRPLPLGLRRAGLAEYPRCLFQHPSPLVRLAAATTVMVLVAGVLGALLLSSHWRPTLPPAAPAPAETAMTVPAEPATFLGQLAGDWQAPGERLLLRHDRGVVEILRQSRLDTGEVRLDLYAAAPVRFAAAEGLLVIETPDGEWRLALLPGARRAQLSVTDPDGRHVLYE